MRAKQLVKMYERGVINEEELKQALLAALDAQEITLAEYQEAIDGL